MTFFNMEPSYSIHWYSIIGILFPTIARIVWDANMIMVEKREVPHVYHTVCTGFLMLVDSFMISIIEPASFWQILFLSFASFFFIFDYALNVIRSKKFFYIDTGTIHSVSDGLYARIGVPGTAFFKVVIMLLAISLYFFFPYVTGDKTPW